MNSLSFPQDQHEQRAKTQQAQPGVFKPLEK